MTSSLFSTLSSEGILSPIVLYLRKGLANFTGDFSLSGIKSDRLILLSDDLPYDITRCPKCIINIILLDGVN